MKFQKLFLVLVLLTLGCSGGVYAGESFYATFDTSSIRWSQLQDYGEYLGPAGSTNPAYTVGYSVFDYYGNAPQPDGKFDYEQLQDMTAQVPASLLIFGKYDPSGSVSERQNPFNPNEVFRTVSNLSEDNGFVSLNVNVLGHNFSIHKALTKVSVASKQNSAVPSSSYTTLELKYYVFDSNFEPGVYEFNSDPSYNFPIPSQQRHINANVSNWYNNPGTFEVIDGVSEDRDFTLMNATVRVYFDGVAIPNLTSLDLSDPSTAALITSIFVEFEFDDAQTQYPGEIGRLSIAYNGELGTSLNEDLDADGQVDTADNCPAAPNFDQTNTDGVFNDGGDACDTDDDNDGVYDIEDNCPLISNPDQGDDDGDGIGNFCDSDWVPTCVGCGCPAS